MSTQDLPTPEELSQNILTAVQAQFSNATEDNLSIAPSDANFLLSLLGSPYSLYNMTTDDRIAVAGEDGVPEQVHVVVNHRTGDVEIFTDFESYETRVSEVTEAITVDESTDTDAVFSALLGVDDPSDHGDGALSV